ncbi:unnamed protein product [Orchesella dallaii]|uniref:Uncharacterized protein n=1 Tax=Orchesella dallaii TaxID=48710 RepID=A0ABP1REA4_9HEXA
MDSRDIEGNKGSDREKSLREENTSLKGQMKELETTYSSLQAEFSKSIKMRDRLDSLCKELQKQTLAIKEESAAKIQEAEAQGNQLADDVTSNMGIMESVHSNLATTTNESMEAKKANTDLIGQISTLKEHYDSRQKDLTVTLEETNDNLIRTKLELSELRMKYAQDREQTYGDMQKLATSLVESRLQMKNAKELELELRILIQDYDQKFSQLQKALEETNVAYGVFKDDMDKVALRAKDLETETLIWQKKWDESNEELSGMTKNHNDLQTNLFNVHEKLIKITGLYRVLEKERYEMMTKLGRQEQALAKSAVELLPPERFVNK